jgi:hypothetical protein
VKILVAIPVYDGKIQVEVVTCLISEQLLSAASGDELSFSFLPNCSHPAMGRNQLATDFMNSDAERLIFLDSDVSFEPGAIVKIAHAPVDFVGGAYRYKKEAEEYPVGWIQGKDLWANEHGFLEVATLPGGFLSLSRKVFEKFQEKHPRAFEHFGFKMHGYFQMPFVEGLLYGEDAFFCREWREMGEKVFLDPEIKLTHWNFNRPFPGHVGKWLKQQNGLI